jgi:ABC-type multidrug transport system ATPase subunit
VAQRVILVNEGRLAFDGTPTDLKQRGEGQMDRAFHALTGAN